MPNATQEFLDRHVISGSGVDYESFLPQDEIKLVRNSADFHAEVLEFFLHGEKKIGQCLPFARTDEFLFRPGELTVYTGYNASRKSMLQSQIILGIIAQGATVMLASLEMSPLRTLIRMAKQYVGRELITEEDLVSFFSFVDSKLFLYDQTGTISATRMLGICYFSADVKHVDHIFIDSLMKLAIAEDGYNAQKALVNSLCVASRDRLVLVHLVCHSRKQEGGREDTPSTKYQIAGTGSISNLADNVLICFSVKEDFDDEKEYDQVLTVAKQRNGEHEPQYLLKFNAKCLQFSSAILDSFLNEEIIMDEKRWCECDWA